MTILKTLPLISQDLMKVLERRKNGKYRSEKNRKTVAIADMKDVLRRYESDMDTDVEKALIYGLNLAIYNKLSDLTNDEFETYIVSICAILNGFTSAAVNYDEKYEEVIYESPGPKKTDDKPVIHEPKERSTDGCRRISSGMIPYREV